MFGPYSHDLTRYISNMFVIHTWTWYNYGPHSVNHDLKLATADIEDTESESDSIQLSTRTK